MSGLGLAIASVRSQASVSGAVGVGSQKHTPSTVQADGHANLFENEVLFEVVARRSQGLGSPGNDDPVGLQNSSPLEKFSRDLLHAVIEAAEHRRIGNIRIRRGIEVEEFSHRELISILTL